jgi:pSer/pThr/pTyr-binding forkhead associated (FHA) protein
MPARLVPLNDSASLAISLQRPVLLIGRHPECDVRIDLPQVSRRHCCVALAYDRLTIRDLGSHNGIRVNGMAVEETVLLPGDEVAIAHLIYRLEDGGALRPAPVVSNLTPLEPIEPGAGVAQAVGSSSASHDPDEELIPLDDLYPSM